MLGTIGGFALSLLAGVGVAAAVTVVGVNAIAGVNTVEEAKKANPSSAAVNGGAGTSVYGN
jgi:hypothetical protein